MYAKGIYTSTYDMKWNADDGAATRATRYVHYASGSGTLFFEKAAESCRVLISAG